MTDLPTFSGLKQMKRKGEAQAECRKKRKGNAGSATSTPDASQDHSGPSKRRPHIRKLAPPRPFPTVASASSATGPRSAHHEGKNNICITRKTKLAAYLRRCKDLLVNDDFKELRLSAMGAAIPHLALLAVSLPPILPWAENQVHVDVFTGSVEVHDEVLSESGSEVEDGPQEEFRTRVKSTMSIIIRIGQGVTSDISLPGSTSRTAKYAERQIDMGIGGVQREEGLFGQTLPHELEQDGMETS